MKKSIMKLTWFITLIMVSLFSISLTGFAAKPITVDFWHHESPTHRVEAFDKVIKMFEKENPGIKVTQHVVPWGDALTKASSSIAAGNPPDFMFSTADLTLTMYRTGSLLATDDIIKEIDKKYSIIKSQLVPYAYKGNYWGVPIFSMSYALSYRPSFLQKYVGTTEPPKTHEQFLEYAKKMTVDTDNDGKIDIYGMGLPAGKNLLTSSQIYSLMINYGALIYDKNGKVVFNSPATIKALTFYKNLFQYSPPGATSWAWGEQEMAFAAGKVAMMLGNGIPCARRFYDAQNFDLAACEQPYPADGVRGSINFTNDVCVFKQVKKRGNYAAVKKFITFMMRPDANTVLTNSEPLSFLPATKAAVEYKPYFGDPIVSKFESSAKTILSSVSYGKLYGFEHGKWVNFGIAEVAGSNLLAEIAQKVAVGEMTPEEAAKWGQAQIEALSASAK
jgi:multiple sugar transport system substrate-binding protein